LESLDQKMKMRLQQGFATGETGFRAQFAQQQFCRAHVCFGSKADISECPSDVRFTPKSGHWLMAIGMSAKCQKQTWHTA
jgi:hypothetical protein